MLMSCDFVLFFFFFNDTATTEIYTLSLHDALPISILLHPEHDRRRPSEHALGGARQDGGVLRDRKSTRLNSSHQIISYAVFCLKKKKQVKTGTKTIVPLDVLRRVAGHWP